MYYNTQPAVKFLTHVLEEEKTSGLDRDPFLRLQGATSMEDFDPSVFHPAIHFKDGSSLSHVMRTSFFVSVEDYVVEYWILIHESKDKRFTLQTYSGFQELPALIGK